MKKGLFVVFALLLIFLSAPALALWYYDAESVVVDLDISSSIRVHRDAGSSMSHLAANVSFLPLDDPSQSVLSLEVAPPPYDQDDMIVFRWEEPVPSDPGFDIKARVKTSNTFQRVPKILFPYKGFSDDVAKFLEPADIIDSDDPRVVSKASELAAGETDYYSVVFRIADWTKENVDYDLSTLNQKTSQKASWVLARKDGVCDEITSLFIALLRAVGIPAKFVSGIAYTESPEFPRNWGAHGWAEVYFPGVGWVPYDVTYGQYGFTDPTHVKLKESFDAGESDVSYEWLGSGVEISANPISVSADLVSHLGFVPDRMDISLDMLQDEVGIGSYNVVEATVQNRLDSYVSSFLYLARINELEVEGNNYKSIMLAPGETRTFYWLVKVIDSLSDGYTYTFPMTVANLRNTSADSGFIVVPGATVFSRMEMEQVIDAAVQEEKKVYSKKIDISCSRENETYYVYDDPVIGCVATNTGNFPFRALEFCFSDECRTADLAISQSKAFSYTLHSPDAGVNKIAFSVEGDEVSKSFFYDLDVLDEPDVTIDDIEYPAHLRFGRPYVVAFTLKKSSSSVPQDVVLELDAAGLTKSVEVAELAGDKKFIFNLDSGDLSTDGNRFTISVVWEDLNGRTYTEREEFGISLVDVTFGQRLVIMLHDIDRWLRNLFK